MTGKRQGFGALGRPYSFSPSAWNSRLGTLSWYRDASVMNRSSRFLFTMRIHSFHDTPKRPQSRQHLTVAYWWCFDLYTLILRATIAHPEVAYYNTAPLLNWILVYYRTRAIAIDFNQCLYCRSNLFDLVFQRWSQCALRPLLLVSVA